MRSPLSPATRQRLSILAAGAAIAIAAAVGGYVIAARSNGSPPDRDREQSAGEPTIPTTPHTIATASFDGWLVDLGIARTRFGALKVETGDLHAAPSNNAGPWLQHELSFRNLGRRPLRFDDTRTSVFLHKRAHARLLVADEGCGYGLASPDAPAEAGACQNYLDAFEVPGHGAETREITISKDLSGMGDLIQGRYVFRKRMVFKIGESDRKAQATIRIVYNVRRDESAPVAARVTVPNIVGMDLAEAMDALEDTGLSGDVSALRKTLRGYAGGFQTHPRARVTSTNPRPGTQLDTGTIVAILDAKCPPASKGGC